MERGLSRHRAALLERRRGTSRRARLSSDRFERSLRATTVGCPTRASILSPPTTASRCTIWSATTTSTTKPTAKKIATVTMKISVGIAAPKETPTIRTMLALRERQKRNFLATLLLSQGVPMLLAGDEIGRTQQGNNNAYCQDNEVSWIDWKLDRPRRELLEFTSYLIRLVASASGAAAPPFFSRAADPRLRSQRPRLVSSRRQGDDR